MSVSKLDIIKDMQNVFATQGKDNPYLSAAFYEKHGVFSVGWARSKFGTWNNALKEAGIPIHPRHRHASKSEKKQAYIDDLQRVAGLRNDQYLPVPFYNLYGNYSSRAVELFFGSWNKALTEASILTRGCGRPPKYPLALIASRQA